MISGQTQMESQMLAENRRFTDPVQQRLSSLPFKVRELRRVLRLGRMGRWVKHRNWQEECKTNMKTDHGWNKLSFHIIKLQNYNIQSMFLYGQHVKTTLGILYVYIIYYIIYIYISLVQSVVPNVYIDCAWNVRFTIVIPGLQQQLVYSKMVRITSVT